MTPKSILASIAFFGVAMFVCGAGASENGLVAHWEMNEGQGDFAHDAGGKGLDLNISGARWVKQREGFALEFDGIDDVVECVGTDDLNLTEKVSLEAWVYHRGLPRSNTSIIQKGRSYSLGTGYGGNLFFAGRSQTPPLLLPDFWHHMVGVFDGKTVAFYLDGNLIYRADPTQKGPLPDTKNDPLVMASPDASTIFGGMIDDVRIYNRPLSREEVEANYEAGRSEHLNALRVYAYPFNDQVVVQIDPAAWDTLTPDSVIDVILIKSGRDTVAVKHSVESFPTDRPFEADLCIEDLSPGEYDVHVEPRDQRGFVRNRLIAPLHWPKRPAWKDMPSEAMVLNNFVTEIVNVRPGSRDQLVFSNPRRGWVFFSSEVSVKDSDCIELILETPFHEETILRHATDSEPVQEAMRFLDEGDFKLNIECDGKSRPTRIIVRAIPELGFAYLTHSSYPHTFPYGAYDWQFLEDNHLLENLNVIHGGLWEWCVPHAEEWRRQGKKILSNLSLNRNPESLDDLVKDFKRVLRHPLADGMTLDEFPGWGHPGYEMWTKAVRRIQTDQTFATKRLYPYCATLYGWDAPVAFTKAIVDSDYRIVWERYLSEAPTQLAARRFIFASLGERMRLWEKYIPGVTSKMILCPNLFTSPSLTADVDPAVDYLVFMDMRFNHLANDSAFWGVAGVLPWGAAYADEEVFRWLGKLYRHYCIEGKTEMLTSAEPAPKGKTPDTLYRREYKLTHLGNGNFAADLDGWTVLPGDKGTIEARTEIGFDRVMGQWSPAIQRDSFCWMKRDQWAPNTIVQQIKNLQPNRFYSLRFYTRDFREPETRKELCVSATITPAEIIPEKSFQHVYTSYAGGKGWLNFHRLVFRAESSTARLEISDWKMEPGRPFFSGEEGHVYIGAPEGQEIMITSVQVQPYMAD